MQNKHTISIFILFISLLISNLDGFSQKLVNYKAENQPLNIVLTKISSLSKVRFAFDDDYFSKINVSFNVNKLTVEEFLKQLCIKYPVAYKLIGGTWVVYKDEKKVVSRPKSKVEVVKPVPPPVIKKKIVYKKARLWDLIGTIIDVKSGNRLKFCQLFVDEYTNPLTNNLGYFSDEIVSTGDVRVKVNQFGYYPLDTTFMLFDGNEILLKLNPIWKIENSFLDSYSGIFQFKLPHTTDFVELNPRSGSYIPGIDASDFANSTKLLAGINLSEENNAGLSNRGIYPSDNQILLDGIPVLNFSHLSGQLSAINAKFIHQAFISRGGFGAEYGESSSGIIELTGKSGQGRPVVDFTANMLDANLFAGIPINRKISVSGSFRKSIVDYWPNYYYRNLVVTPLKLQTVGNNDESGIFHDPFNTFFDINMKLVYQPNILNEFNFIISNSYDHQKRSLNISSDKDYFMNFQSGWRNYGVGLNWKFRSKNFWYNSLVVSLNTLKQNNQVESGYSAGLNIDNSLLHSDNDINNSAEILLKWKSEFELKKYSNQFGAEYNFYSLNYNYLFSEEKSSVLHQLVSDSISKSTNKQFLSLFYEGKYKLYKWIELTAGMRVLFDLYPVNIMFQPRAGIDLIPTKMWKFYYHFGRYIQPYYQTQRIATNLKQVPVWMLPTNSDQFIKSYHNIVGGNFSYGGLLANVEGYRMKSSGRAAYFSDLNDGDNSSAETYKIYKGSENRMGVDATIRFHHNIFNHSLAYSFSGSKEKYVGMNSDNFYPSFNSPQHHLKITETVAFSGWTASASFSYLSGKHYLLPNSTFEQFNISKLPAFSQLDVSLVRQFSVKSVKIETGAVLLNVLGTNIEKKIEFFQPDNLHSDLFLKSTTFGIPFTPTFFVTIKFD